MNEVLASVRLFKPELALTAALLLVVLVDAFRPRGRDVINRGLTIAGMGGALAVCLPLHGKSASLFSGMVVLDPLAVYFKILLIASSLLVILIFTFRNSRELSGLGQGEFYALMLAVTLSNVLMSTANDLAMLYLALEMVSISSYVMVAYVKADRMPSEAARLSNEASLKYILFGAVSTGAMLYGLSLLYGLTGTTSLPLIRDFLASGVPEVNRLAVVMVTLLVLAGFGFKTAAVPFHFWCPDVYQGAPTPVTAFLSIAPKAAGFAIMLRFFFSGMASGTGWELSGAVDWPRVLMLVSVLTMTVGNVAALTQTNMKRLLAYSSIAHAGFIMMGVVALSANGARAMMIYLLAYVFMNLGAFLVVTLVHAHDGTFDLRDYPGLYRRAPGLTVAMAIFLLSLMGIPPLVGFMGKLYVFAAVIEKGYGWFALAGALNAAVAGLYHARVLTTIILEAGNEDKAPLKLALPDAAWVAVLAAANVVPILGWQWVENWARASLSLIASR